MNRFRLLLFIIALLGTFGYGIWRSISPRQISQPIIDSAPPIISPAEMSKALRAVKLTNDAYKALYAGKYSIAEQNARAAELSGTSESDPPLAEALYAQGKKKEALEYRRIKLPYALLLLKEGRWHEALAVYKSAESQLNREERFSASSEDTVKELLIANSKFSTDKPKPIELATNIHIIMGVKFHNKKNYFDSFRDVKAMHEFEQALQLSPNSDIANYFYARELEILQNKRSPEAKAAYEKAIKYGHGEIKLAANEELTKYR